MPLPRRTCPALKDGRQRGDIRCHVRVIGPEGLLTDRDRPAGGLAAGVAAASVFEAAQVVVDCGHVRVVGTEGLSTIARARRYSRCATANWPVYFKSIARR